MSRTARHSARSRGFTLIEVLVALAALSILLAAVGTLASANTRGVRKIADHFALAARAQAVLADIANGAPTNASGGDGNISWRIQARPFLAGARTNKSGWRPERITISLRDASGGRFQLETVRLIQRGAP